MGNAGSFKKGHQTWNKGKKGIHLSPKSEFKAGDHHTGQNHPSWKGGIQNIKSDCTYIWIGNNERARRPRHIYEQHFGLIPKGFVIAHKDGNKDNDHPDNLEAISRGELMKRNSRHKQPK